ncbi:hypothetical protein EDB86DRAFT_2834917 [Lactarius hatsudake]|nr:hypothetical protein EDB86DRAFT_2834917 [Lactarius hatsudake]
MMRCTLDIFIQCACRPLFAPLFISVGERTPQLCPAYSPAGPYRRWLCPACRPVTPSRRYYQQGASRPESLSDAHPLRVQMPPRPSSTAIQLPALCFNPLPRPSSDPTDTARAAHLGRRDHIFAQCGGLKTRGWSDQRSRKDKQGELIAADGLPIRCQLADPEGKFVRKPPRVTTELKYTIMQRRPELLTQYHRCPCAPELSRLCLCLLVKCPLPLQGLTDGFGLRMPYFFLDLFPLPSFLH